MYTIIANVITCDIIQYIYELLFPTRIKKVRYCWLYT